MCQPTKNPIEAHINRRIRRAISAILFLYLSLAVCITYLPSAFWRTTLSVVNGLLFFAIVGLSALLTMRVVDEFQRVLLMRSFAWATFFTVSITSVWGHMELSPGSTIPHLPTLAFPVLLILFTTIAKVLIFRSNRPVEA